MPTMETSLYSNHDDNSTLRSVNWTEFIFSPLSCVYVRFDFKLQWLHSISLNFIYKYWTVNFESRPCVSAHHILFAWVPHLVSCCGLNYLLCSTTYDNINNINIYRSVGRYKKANVEELRFSQLEARHSELSLGGHWSPEPECRARQRIALIVPFRDRTSHLKIFLGAIHPMLQNQLLEYTVFVVEQVSVQFTIKCWIRSIKRVANTNG